MVAPRRRIWSPAFFVRSRAIAKGVLGGDRFWRGVAAVVFGASFLRRTFGRTMEVLTIERLRPGESVLVRTIAPMTRRDRRASRRG
jgi:hypothetical protein